MGTVEQVLVVERTAFDRAGGFQGISFEVERFLEALFAAGAPRFIPRPQAEADPRFKQLIPYVLMTDGDSYVTYVRGKAGGEKRLVGNRSLGIGGHINPTDDLPLLSSDLRDAYRAAVAREVAEEVVIDAAPPDRIVALLNDDSTEVGRVHLGIVHYWRFPQLVVRKREQAITQFSFMTPAELRAVRDSLESWSQLCLDHLGVLADAAANRTTSPAIPQR
ncbi:MAG: hypothetical protein HY763_09405 [Planctomycetes bacterium]|nr:hypothetical protein [Planctomycetota bacterium]